MTFLYAGTRAEMQLSKPFGDHPSQPSILSLISKLLLWYGNYEPDSLQKNIEFGKFHTRRAMPRKRIQSISMRRVPNIRNCHNPGGKVQSRRNEQSRKTKPISKIQIWKQPFAAPACHSICTCPEKSCYHTPRYGGLGTRCNPKLSIAMQKIYSGAFKIKPWLAAWQRSQDHASLNRTHDHLFFDTTSSPTIIQTDRYSAPGSSIWTIFAINSTQDLEIPKPVNIQQIS